MLRLRAIIDDDLPALLDLWVASWETLGLAVDFDARRAWLPEHLASLQAGGAELIGTEESGKLIGFVTINPQTGWLDQLAVHPAFFGTGVAVTLMGQAKRRGPGFVELDVIADNPRAIRFYEREGFKIIGEGISPRSGLKTLLMRWPEL